MYIAPLSFSKNIELKDPAYSWIKIIIIIYIENLIGNTNYVLSQKSSACNCHLII